MTRQLLMNPSSRTRRAVTLTGSLVAGTALGILLLFALPVVSGTFGSSRSDAVLPDPNVRLAEAKAAAPYGVKLPGSPPPGVALEHVEWDTDIEGVVVVDVWFSLPSGGRLHIWQSNTTSPIESIPPGETVAIDGRSWSQVSVDWTDPVLQLSTRFEEGVTVTVDAPESALDAEGLAKVAASIS